MASLLVQIQRWLKQSKVWRFVGFASAVVGLLCYALSSSFNYLFGDWNLLKTFLYTVFSFIICVAILYAKVWQPSASLRSKAHMAFLVLTITSFYSFFFDKAVNGKPDAYSLISCGAFAMMSLSLSRQTHCGFEVDLLYFFLGALIVQLMKIKWWLGLVGVAFSYSLVILRSCLDSQPEASGYIGFQDQPDVVIQVGSLQLQSHANSAIALAIIPQEDSPHDQTITQVNSHSQEDKTEIALIKPYLLASMKVLKQMKRNLINTLSNHIRVPRPDPDLLIDTLPSDIINNLNEVVKLGIAAGFEKKCCDMYITCRKEFLRQCLYAFGIPDLVKEDNKDNVLETTETIEGWTRTFKIAIRLLFPTERRLCDSIFFRFSSAADLSFMEVCRGSAIQLLSFADMVAIGSRSPERLFKILDVFETLRDLIPEFEVLFSDQYSVSLRNEAITIWKRLGEAIRGIFMELENLIRHDPAKDAVPGGGLHPITRYVMNYLRAACRSRQTLEQVFEDYGHPLKDYPKLDDRIASNSSLSVQMDWIMELLESNLEAKSKIYKDPALCYVFLMNNGRYIVQKVKDSELGTLLGDDWIQKHTAKVRQYHVHYQRNSWNKVLGILKLDSNGSVGPKGVAKSMKDKLKLFNAQFEDICRAQSSWFVFDEQLREEIRISLEKILLPAYGNFITRFQNVQELGKNADRYIKYGVEDIEARLNDLFQGSSGSAGSRK